MNSNEDYIDIAEKTFDLSLEEASSDEDESNTEKDVLQQSHIATPILQQQQQQQQQQQHQQHRQQINVLGSISNNDVTEPPMAKATTLRSHTISNDSDLFKKPPATASKVIENSKDTEINLRLCQIISQLSKVSGNQINPRYRQEQDPSKLLSFIVRLAQNCQSKFDFLHDNCKYTNDLYESCLREKGQLKMEIEDLKKTNKALQLKSRQRSNQTTGLDGLNEEEQIFKLKKEIKEYKRFIKELMDRE